MDTATTSEDVACGVCSAYDQIAETYAAVNAGEVPAALLRLARQLVGYLGRGARLLEIGCGAGRDMGWFESQGIRVTGIDLSPAMLRCARRVTAGPLSLMDMKRLAFRDACFDGAWCSASLLHLPKREAPSGLRAIRRILKPGGVLMLSVQEGAGEAWEGGYVEGVERFFARYGRAEMGMMLADASCAVREIDAQRTHRDWLSFLCVAD